MIEKTLHEVAEVLNCTYHGDGNIRISAINTLDRAKQGEISFFDNPRYRPQLLSTKASVVILREADLKDCKVAALVSANPYLTYARLAELYQKKQNHIPGMVHKTAVIGEACDIHPTVTIGAHCVVGDGVRLSAGVILKPGCVLGNDICVDENTFFHANVTVYDDVRIGANCIFHSGVVIGSDGFGNAKEGSHWVKVPQLGGVTIGNRVEVGANTTIDCGSIGDTIIEDGVRIDNLVMIAHNVTIGENTAMAGCSAIAGSTTVGKNCLIGGNVGINGHIKLADQVMLTGSSMVTHSLLSPGLYSSGIPVDTNRAWRKNAIRFKQLNDLAKRIDKLEKQKGGD